MFRILFLKVSCHRKPNKIKETLNNYAKAIGKVSQIGIINVKTVHEGNLTMKGLDTVESLSVEVKDSKVANFSVLEALSSSNVAETKSGGLYIVVY